MALSWLGEALPGLGVALGPPVSISTFCFLLLLELTSLDHTNREGNNVISDPAVQPKAFDWQAAFPELASTAEVEPAAKRRKRPGAAKPQRGRKN
jgi:hypothetical protein